jgi:hypothetical protein
MTPNLWGALGVIVLITIQVVIVWNLPKHKEQS